MYAFTEIKEKFAIENLFSIMQYIFSQNSIEEFVMKQITTRLYTQGTDRFLNKLATDAGRPYYSLATQMEKIDKGQKITNVTLSDTEEFYNSFQIEAKKYYFEIKADFQKEDGNIYENFKGSYSNQSNFENAIAALSENEMNNLLEQIKPKIIELLKKL